MAFTETLFQVDLETFTQQKDQFQTANYKNKLKVRIYEISTSGIIFSEVALVNTAQDQG